ncbi:cytochrome P450 [Rhodofomes roseus]|uniref:Cytochrome P450 n=1 Tax=Rhodofomes roseus TaxID=34475 RepID=A0ABQ8KF05_9APHY|nr:cytochrome P450 [Rhodofomes roseus]KAH9836319.1 cytochrome P450 [Rhodofomes roseus]
MDPYLVTALLALPILYSVWRNFLTIRTLSRIPTVGGPSIPILDFIGAIRYLMHSDVILWEGYQKYRNGAFKHRDVDGWHVLVSGPKLVEEMCRAPENVLSLIEASKDAVQTEWTLGPSLDRVAYHIPIIRNQFTRALTPLFGDMHDEIVRAFDDNIPKAKDWIKVPMLPTMMEVVCRTSNRLFVGLPLCRDRDYVELNKRFTIDVFVGGQIIRLFPDVLKPTAVRLLTKVHSGIQRGTRHLQPLIEERLRMMKEHGKDWPDKPNDMLQWVMDEAEGEELQVDRLVIRIMTINITAINTSSMTFTNAMFYLAAHPEWLKPLRDEVEEVTKAEGWTKDSVNRFAKIDSFLRESQRYCALGTKSLRRTAMQDYTFSDGTFIPKGTKVAIPMHAIHHDEDIYPHADVFDPWRWSEIRKDDTEATKFQMVSTGPEHVAFGHGRHGCPGRFFVASELKAMLAHLVLNYDIKMEKEGQVPPVRWFGTRLYVSRSAEVMFRKRQT